ncbi:MAG: alpha/beta-type small acid-soluble spore protein [Actinomycetia bacterium]|nr:alpha/beta-type small acid-soluble spore protein [Actinomycetes bacterium]
MTMAKGNGTAADGPAGLKVQVAKDLGLWEKVERLGWGGLTARESGRVGGEMTRRRARGGLAAPGASYASTAEAEGADG